MALVALAAFALPSSAFACPPVPTLVSFEPNYQPLLPPECNQTVSPYAFGSVVQDGGSFQRVRPSLETDDQGEPDPVPDSPYGGLWAAKLKRTTNTGSVYAEKEVNNWAPGAGIYYQMRFWLRANVLDNLPAEGVYLMRWENDAGPGPPSPNDVGKECGGVVLTRHIPPQGQPSNTEGKLHVVRQDECGGATPPQLPIMSSQGTIREQEWTLVWVNQELGNGSGNNCGAFLLPTCTTTYTAATLGNEGLQLSAAQNYDGGVPGGGQVAENVKRLRYGIMPVTTAAAGSTLEIFADCLGQSDPCAQEFPIRAAFYDSKVFDNWGSPLGSGVEYTPTPGFYSFSSSLVRQHMREMQYAGLQAGISKWEGLGTPSDQRLTTMLAESAASTGGGFKWAINYTGEAVSPVPGNPDPSGGTINTALQGLHTRLWSAGYLKAQGKPVIFVAAHSADTANNANGCDMVRRWDASGALDDFYVVMRPFPGYLATEDPESPLLNCEVGTDPRKPSSWHEDPFDSSFEPPLEPSVDRVAKEAPATETSPLFSHTITPGFEERAETGARLPRDYLRWSEDVRGMVDRKADWQLMPFNHWVEGAATESATEWASPSAHGFYLDTLHSDGQESALPTIVVAAGDIACGPFDAQPQNDCHQMDTSDLFVDPDPGETPPWKLKPGVEAVLTLGDNQYFCGSYAPGLGIDEFNAPGAFNATWGRVKSKIKPAPGNHEYILRGPPDDVRCPGTGKGYFDYFLGLEANGMSGQPPAGARGEGWYSFDLGADWHLISLNSQLCEIPNGRVFCDTGAQGVWLGNDLARFNTPPDPEDPDCILAYWHHPRYDSWRQINTVNHDQDGNVRPFWTKLRADYVKADLVLNGHQHLYERFPPQSGAITNPETADGIREIIVGTGGKGIYTTFGPDHQTWHVPTSETYPDGLNTYGILQLAMYDRLAAGGDGSYSWQFVPESRLYTPPLTPGTVFQDSGADACN